MKLRNALKKVSSIIHDPSLFNYARIIPSSFTREDGKMPLRYLLTYLIFRHGRTLSEDICTIYPALNDMNPPSKQAVLKRMRILNYSVWYQIQNLFLERIYRPMPKRTEKGYLLIAVDGTFVTLPRHEALYQIFGCRTHVKKGSDKPCHSPPQAKMSIAYDVLNHVVLDFRIAPCDTSEIPLLFTHLEALENLLKDYKVILLADRYYGSAELFKYCEMKGYKYLVRAKSNFFKKERAEIPEDCSDSWFTRIIDQTWQKRIVRLPVRMYIKDNPELKIRLVKGTYEYDEEENTTDGRKKFRHHICTAEYFTDLSEEEFSEEEIIRLYHVNRWDIETGYGTMKNIIDIEQVNSANPISCMNEILACIVFCNIENLVRMASEEKLSKTEEGIHLANHKHVIGMCTSSWFIRSIFNNRISEKKLHDLVKECTRVKVMIRDGRHYKRWDKFRTSLHQDRHRIDGRNNPPLKMTKAGIMTSKQ